MRIHEMCHTVDIALQEASERTPGGVDDLVGYLEAPSNL